MTGNCFAQLYDRFSSAIFSAAFRIVNNQQAAEDVLQEVFLQVWEKAALYDPARGNLDLGDHADAEQGDRPPCEPLSAGGDCKTLSNRMPERRNNSMARNSFDAVDLLEKGKLVGEALRKLVPEQREALELAFFSGLTQSEIAEHLNEPLGTVKARIRRGMMRLKSLLDSELR